MSNIAYAQSIADALRSPRQRIRITLLLLLIIVWFVVGVQTFRTPIIDHITQYDFVVFHKAVHMFLAGDDLYGPGFATWMTGDPTRERYAYPPGSLWVVLPFALFPVPFAATLWVSTSLIGLVACMWFIGRPQLHLLGLLCVLFYPTLYAFQIVQWAPIQIVLFGMSIWLYRHKLVFWAGAIIPLVMAKPTTGIGLILLAMILCGRDRRWWIGGVVGALFWYGLPFAVQPDWPQRWIDSLAIYASPAAHQHLVTLTSLPDGKVCFVAAVVVGIWSAQQRRWTAFGCTLLVLAMLATPHRAQYDYPVFFVPLLFLSRRHLWLAVLSVVMSWVFPITYELGWASSLQLTLFTIAPAILACALVEELSLDSQASAIPLLNVRDMKAETQ